mmetsp:Transcript_130544/g.325690  ORF Transcript_130544/g.325690 Transcript_130544/m.325690 type:complete len:208 (-) Transcript_130544:627-1250(-)
MSRPKGSSESLDLPPRKAGRAATSRLACFSKACLKSLPNICTLLRVLGSMRCETTLQICVNNRGAFTIVIVFATSGKNELIKTAKSFTKGTYCKTRKEIPRRSITTEPRTNRRCRRDIACPTCIKSSITKMNWFIINCTMPSRTMPSMSQAPTLATTMGLPLRVCAEMRPAQKWRSVRAARLDLGARRQAPMLSGSPHSCISSCSRT